MIADNHIRFLPVTGKVKITSLFDKITTLFDKITTLFVKITSLFNSFRLDLLLTRWEAWATTDLNCDECRQPYSTELYLPLKMVVDNLSTQNIYPPLLGYAEHL